MTREAIPTDFMGIRFRSKSEAMFANVLEHIGHSWCYEPKFLASGDYTPDFLLVTKNKNTLVAHVIEYKPRKPTHAYFERLLKKSRNMIPLLGDIPKTFSVVAVNFFEPFNATEWCIKSGSWVASQANYVTEEIFNSVKSFRYDLDHSGELLPDQRVGVVYKSAIQTPGEHKCINKKHARISGDSLRALVDWRVSICQIKSMVHDYAGLAVNIIVDGDNWNVVFPPGAKRAAEVCEKINRCILEQALSSRLHRKINLSFSVQCSSEPNAERLKRAFEVIRGQVPLLSTSLQSLSEQNGQLMCEWSLGEHMVSKAVRGIIASAWDDICGQQSSVTHEYI